MENKIELKPFDKVLVRNKITDAWIIDLYEKHKESSSGRSYSCLVSIWVYCIPYEGNEHLLGTTDAPGRYDPNENTLFGIEIKPGYVLEFEYGKIGVIFPIREISSPQKKRLALMYTGGAWVQFEFIDSSKVIAIRGLAYGSLLTNGELLWERAKKQSLTKLEIAEKLGMKVKDFEIVNE